MKEKNPLEPLLAEVAALLEKIQTHKKEIQDIPPEVLQRLALLEQTINIFEEMNQRTLTAAQIDIDKLTQETLTSPDLAPQEKKFFERIQVLKQDSTNLHARLAKVVARAQKDNQKDQSDENKKLNRERQKKFKRLGGKGWIPS
jgi:ribonuclease HII